MLFAGIDGGATSTKCIIVDEKGHVLGYGKGGPANHVYGDKGKERLRSALQDSVGTAADSLDYKSVDSVGIGMTGLKQSDKTKEIISVIASEVIKFNSSVVVEDIKIALAGCNVERYGVLVYAGTGANTFGVDKKGQEVSVGGWGHIIDDKGAGYDIGRMSLRKAFRSLDGRCPETSLTDKLMEHFGCQSMQGVRHEVYVNDGLPRPQIGELSKLVYEGAEEGDKVSQKILREAGETLGQTIIVALEKLGVDISKFPIFKAGGVFNIGSWIVEPLIRVVEANLGPINLRNPRFPPVVGGVFMAMRDKGLEPDREFVNTLEKEIPTILTSEGGQSGK